jgi:hypothetical protein
MTEMMRKITASSTADVPDSNFECEMVLLSSANASRIPGELGEISSHTKNVWSALRAADVIGAVASGERISARKGESISDSGIVDRSIGARHSRVRDMNVAERGSHAYQKFLVYHVSNLQIPT